MPIKMKVCNRVEYNQSLKDRGRVFHLFNEATKIWLQKEKSKYIYSEQLIQILAVFRYLFKYPFRQLQGLLEDYISESGLSLPVPDFTTLCRRMAKLASTLTDHRKEMREGKIDILIDSTGINIYHTSGGHTKENIHSRKFKHYDQVRKMHIALDCENKDVIAMHMTSGSTADCDVVPILLKSISCSIGAMYADGAYDRSSVRKICVKKKIKQIIPPRRNAVIRKAEKEEDPHLWDERNSAVKMIHRYSNVEKGRKKWKKINTYGKRSYVEAFFSRFKLNFGFHFMSKSEAARQSELIIKIKMLNDYNQLGIAQFEKVA